MKELSYIVEKYFKDTETLIVETQFHGEEYFDKKIQFANKVFVIEKIILFGRTNITDLTTKDFCTLKIANTEHYINNFFEISKIHQQGNELYVQAKAELFIDGTTSLHIDTTNTLFSEIYKKAVVLSVIDI